MSKKDKFAKYVIPKIEELIQVCNKYDMPYLFVVQTDDLAEGTPCELNLTSNVAYLGVAAVLCDIQDKLTADVDFGDTFEPESDSDDELDYENLTEEQKKLLN